MVSQRLHFANIPSFEVPCLDQSVDLTPSETTALDNKSSFIRLSVWYRAESQQAALARQKHAKTSERNKGRCLLSNQVEVVVGSWISAQISDYHLQAVQLSKKTT